MSAKSNMHIWLRTQWRSGSCALMVLLAWPAMSPAADDIEIEDKSFRQRTDVRVFSPRREESEAHPDDELLDPFDWDEDDGTADIQVEEEENPTASEDDLDYEIPVGCDPPDIDTDDLRMVDMLHHRFSRGLCGPTEWLDNSFGDPLDDFSGENGSTTVRLIGGQEFREDGDHSTDTKLKARINLPYLEKRFSLMLASDNDEEDEDASYIRDYTNDDSNSVSAALQWARERSNGLSFRVSGGFHHGLNGQVKFALRKKKKINDLWSLRATEKVDWRDNEGWRSRSYFDLDRAIGPVRMFRATTFFENSRELHRDGRANQWRQSALVAAQLNKRLSIRYIASVEGYTEPRNRVDNYRGAVTFRRNVWRPWFYFEVEPFVIWERDRHYRTTFGGVLRFETIFGEY